MLFLSPLGLRDSRVTILHLCRSSRHPGLRIVKLGEAKIVGNTDQNPKEGPQNRRLSFEDVVTGIDKRQGTDSQKWSRFLKVSS